METFDWVLFFKDRLNGFVKISTTDSTHGFKVPLTIGDKVVSAMRRTGKKDFRANISQEGSGEAVELSEADQALCIKASQVLGLDFSGVDLIKDQDENSLCGRG